MTTPPPVHLPLALRPGDRIHVVAPASTFPADRFELGVGWLREQGFEVTWREDITSRHHYVAGSVARRLDELAEAFSDPRVRAVLCARGGYGSMALLPHLPWEQLAADRKIVLAYSDLTPMLNGLTHRTGLVTFHGPVVAGLMTHTSEAGRQALLTALTDPTAAPAPLTGGVCLRPGEVEAPLVGGNLTLVAATLGTPFALQTRGRILLLEEVGERPYRLDRLFTQLRLAGVFDGCAGVALGSFQDCVEKVGRGRDIPDLLEEMVGDLGVPVCYGLPFGHGLDNHTIPLGLPARLCASRGTLTPLGPAVQERA